MFKFGFHVRDVNVAPMLSGGDGDPLVVDPMTFVRALTGKDLESVDSVQQMIRVLRNADVGIETDLSSAIDYEGEYVELA